MIISSPLFSLGSVAGIWKTTDNRKGFATSIIAVYNYNKKVYGRVIVAFDEKTGDLIDTLYNPIQHIDEKEYYPFLCRTNLFWDLNFDGKRWVGGTVIDPRNGRTYSCELWKEGEVLILRGKWGIFWQNQILYPVRPGDFPPGFIIPDIAAFYPVIPELRK
ncbi:MAG: DUF2147 domain-containing protein [Spirochaetales bacterium]|nr:DUF2147 domain-containing protein [Spirochaetales bacterium]